MEFKNIIQLINTVASTDISDISISEGDFKLSISKNVYTTVHEATGITPLVREAAVHMTDIPPASTDSIIEETAGLEEIKAPLVGLLYRAPGPEQDNFVQVGDHVKKGQVLCIIEAMKLMNEIKCECDGEIIEILAENEEPVEYHQTIFRIKKNK